MDKEFYDKYGKELGCADCPHLTLCLDKKEPQCASGFMQLQDDKISDLEAKLAEKEKQIKKLNNEAQKYYEDAYCNDAIYQDKISFAVDKLEKVKTIISNHTQELWTCENDDIDIDLYNEINQLIAEIKGE